MSSKFPLINFVRSSPISVAAAVIAPFLAENEDRGYFRTALITTPVVFMAGQALPKVFAAAKDISQISFKQKPKVAKTVEQILSKVQPTVRKIEREAIERNELKELLFRNFIVSSDLKTLATEGNKAAEEQIANIIALQSTKRRLISNAFHAANKAAMTPEEWDLGIPEILPDLTNEGMQEMFERYNSRPEFVRNLKNRIMEVPGLEYAGTTATIDGIPNVSITLRKLIDVTEEGLEYREPGHLALREQAPNVLEYLRQAKEKGIINKIEGEIDPNNLIGKNGRLLNVTVYGSNYEKGLTLPIADVSTGMVRTSESAIGVSNHIISPKGEVFVAHDWIAKVLAERPDIPWFAGEGDPNSLAAEIASHNYWFTGDPLDSSRMSELRATGIEGPAIYDAQAIKLRSQAAGITGLRLWKDPENPERLISFYDYEFGARGKVAFLDKLASSKQLIPMGKEAFYEGMFQLRSASIISPYAAPSALKQDPFWRSITKEAQLHVPEQVSKELTLPFVSKGWEQATGSKDIAAIKSTIATVAPKDRVLFSELPKTIEELMAKKEPIVQSFMDRGMSLYDALNMFGDVRRLVEEGKQGALDQLGFMGETGFVFKKSLADKLGVEFTSIYHVDEVGVKVGDFVTIDKALGFRQSNRVLPKASGQVIDIAKSDGDLSVNVRHLLGMKGAKVDIAGIKGMSTTSQEDEFEASIDLINKFYKRTGSSNFIPSNVNVLAPAEYFAEKVEPAQAALGIAHTLVEKLQGREDGGVVNDYLNKMSSLSTTWQNGQFVIDPTNFNLTDTEGAKRLSQLADINEEFFTKAGDIIRKAGGFNDPFLQAFAKSDQSVGEFALRNNFEAVTFAWNHSLLNLPRFAGVSYDVETFMALSGHSAGLKALQNRLVTTSGGDPKQTLEFMKYLEGGDYNKSFGPVVKASEAFPFGKDQLTTPGGRKGTIFDPTIEQYKQNFRIDFGEGKILPVPGTSAYGAEANMYERFGAKEYRTSSWQYTLQDMAFAKDPKELNKLQEKLTTQYRKTLGLGKGSALRPYQYDPLSVPGYLSTTAVDEGDPFIAKVSREWAEQVRSPRLRKALLNNENVIGMMFRQPTGEALYLKYRLDESLNGTMDVRVPEEISRAYLGDQDQDLINNILFDAKLQMESGNLRIKLANSSGASLEEKAAMEGLDAMKLGGRQFETLAQRGTREIARYSSTKFELSPVISRLREFSSQVASRSRIAEKRTAGAAIGALSNVLTSFEEQLVRIPKFLEDTSLATEFGKIHLFDIRQLAIEARKAHGLFSLEQAVHYTDQLKKAVNAPNPEGAMSLTKGSMMSLIRTIRGEDHPSYDYWANRSDEALKVWAYGRTPEGKLVSEAFTTTVKEGIPLSSQRAGRVLSEVYKNPEAVLGTVHSGSAAIESASTLGSLNARISAIGKEVSSGMTEQVAELFAKHGKAMAVGLGSLALLGIALTPRQAPVATFDRESGNKFRPEERISASDGIPGEAVAGHMAPSNPPRTIIPAQQGVRTTIVAPMRQTSDLSVTMKATDTSKAAETSRLLAQIPGSDRTNVTINYRDRTKLRSLRTREKLRELSQ